MFPPSTLPNKGREVVLSIQPLLPGLLGAAEPQPGPASETPTVLERGPSSCLCTFAPPFEAPRPPFRPAPSSPLLQPLLSALSHSLGWEDRKGPWRMLRVDFAQGAGAVLSLSLFSHLSQPPCLMLSLDTSVWVQTAPELQPRSFPSRLNALMPIRYVARADISPLPRPPLLPAPPL